MTALETLAKYGLDTTVKAIRERLDRYNINKLYVADLSVLCSLAEKGERAEKLLDERREKVHTKKEECRGSQQFKDLFWQYLAIEAELIDIINEVEGGGIE